MLHFLLPFGAGKAIAVGRFPTDRPHTKDDACRYTPGTHGLDALIVGFYERKELQYAARVRAGFVPATRREVFAKIKDLVTTKCPFANLPEKQAGRWGQGLTAEKMKECVWLKPETVARIDFLEWTGADHLRHTKFVALRDDKDPRKVVRET